MPHDGLGSETRKGVPLETDAHGLGDVQPLRAIVADDDPLVRRLIRDTLQRSGITVIAEASTGREAVELVLYYRPDVVVMDYMMPELDGLEATRRIYEHDASIR